MHTDQMFFQFPYAFALTFFLAVFNAIGTISLPWLVVFLPILISVSPIVLFGAALMAIVGYVIMAGLSSVVSDYFDGK